MPLPAPPRSKRIAAQEPDRRTLQDALDHTRATRWRGMRGEPSLYCQASLAVATLQAGKSRDLLVCEVTQPMVLEAVTKWQTRGLAPATINKRVACLSALGLMAAQGCLVRQPKLLKWWLKPAERVKLCEWLRSPQAPAPRRISPLLADFVEWTVHTGLRVEESLRLTRGDIEFHEDGRAGITVPGLKTAISQKHLPVGEEARQLLLARGMPDAPPHTPLFPVAYTTLEIHWRLCAKQFGWSTSTGATLKALRRSAARHLTNKGMPLDILRQYLRHENIQTTMGYLRLTGGYDEQETRRWL